jgi:N-dimethylarginine dimethylaminohydrolase
MAEPFETRDEWLALESSMRDDLVEFWGGEWGCDSEVGRLRDVLLRRPGPEIEAVVDPAVFRWLDVMDPELARQQHDALADIYRAHGAEVHYVRYMPENKPNGIFMRDNVLMTPEGAIVGRQAMECRRGEERHAAEALAELGVPILRTISGSGIFETACCLWVDEQTVIIGTGNRANDEGCYQVEEVLRGMGVERIIHLQIPYGYAHIDSIISFVEPNRAIFDPGHLTWDVWTALRDVGIELFAAPDSEEVAKLALNVVALEPGHVVMAAGNPNTRSFYEEIGVRVTECDVSELLKGWGSLHCMSATLRRDPIGRVCS